MMFRSFLSSAILSMMLAAAAAGQPIRIRPAQKIAPPPMVMRPGPGIQALERWSRMTPEQRRRALDRLPPERRQKIEEQEQVGCWARIFRPLPSTFLRPALPLAATACLVLVAGFLTIQPDRIAAPAPAAADSQVREVEQVERALDDIEMLRQFDLVDSSRAM